MRKALSIILAGLLVTLPVEQVLAQARQQRATTPEASLVGGGWPVLRVPAVAPEARPKRSLAEKPLGMFEQPVSSNSDDVPGWSDWSNRKRTVAVLSVIAAGLVAFAVAVALADQSVPQVRVRGRPVWP